ncbi:hypothetical protein RFI_28701 [Reticulomyxa filosa]|uniref:F5/8 type C domain-containing protein n=1 Tax=Reticulomyxa filosa TaxID=46433 RepID=X6M4W9_RETFI|nr:hypothetical protein RFI_28701 [Reticulomyxa filosa]|eukprot:ETO08686.1 hypothetical protein RFI_28701 [Reticulomyxa filosa]
MQTLEHHTKGLLPFVYSHNFDTNDVCHWLGTNKGVDTWQNLALRVHIRVLYSSLAADSKSAHCVVGCELVRCVTGQKKSSWFVIDFKNIKIIPTHCSLKHCITECLRNWKFGVNGQWVTLITHNNDQSLNRKVATHTLIILYHVVKNQSFTRDGTKDVKRMFKYTQDMDSNDLFYFLCTNVVERQWANSVDLQLKSWISIDLKDTKMYLSHYTLRHYNSWDTEALRFLVLEGSDDGVAWIPLRQHAGDKALRKARMAHTLSVETSQYFSRFRIFMTGRNSNINWYLACFGVELYGDDVGGLVSLTANSYQPVSKVTEEKFSEQRKNDAVISGDSLPDDDTGEVIVIVTVIVSQHVGPELFVDAFTYSGDLNTQVSQNHLPNNKQLIGAKNHETTLLEQYENDIMSANLYLMMKNLVYVLETVLIFDFFYFFYKVYFISIVWPTTNIEKYLMQTIQQLIAVSFLYIFFDLKKIYICCLNRLTTLIKEKN